MFLQLNEWYYHSSMCGYQTKPLAVNTEEISDIRANYDPNHNIDGTIIGLKNGRQHIVKESYQKIAEMLFVD